MTNVDETPVDMTSVQGTPNADPAQSQGQRLRAITFAPETLRLSQFPFLLQSTATLLLQPRPQS